MIGGSLSLLYYATLTSLGVYCCDPVSLLQPRQKKLHQQGDKQSHTKREQTSFTFDVEDGTSRKACAQNDWTESSGKIPLRETTSIAQSGKKLNKPIYRFVSPSPGGDKKPRWELKLT